MSALAPIAALLLAGCVRAAHPVAVDPLSGAEVWEGDFRVAAPPGWEVSRNRRWLGNDLFTFTSPDRRDAITIERFREDRRSRDLPLSLVSDALTMNFGRAQGVRPELLGQDEILVADRPAWATTVLRRHGPGERLASTVALRGAGHLVLIGLHTVPEGVDDCALAWQLVLESFELPGEPVPKDPRLEDLLMFPPR